MVVVWPQKTAREDRILAHSRQSRCKLKCSIASVQAASRFCEWDRDLSLSNFRDSRSIRSDSGET